MKDASRNSGGLKKKYLLEIGNQQWTGNSLMPENNDINLKYFNFCKLIAYILQDIIEEKWLYIGKKIFAIQKLKLSLTNFTYASFTSPAT